MINRVVRLLVTSDFVLNFAFGLLSPIFAIFILRTITGSSLRVIGIAAAFYWTARVLSSVPLSRFMDRTDGERDEFYFVIVGSFLASSVPLMYLLISQSWHLYLIQFIYGLANSMALPSWRILFTNHLDRGKTGYEWSLDDVAVGSAVAISAYLGSILADKFGFTIVLVLLSSLGYLATIMLTPIYHDAKTLAQMKKEKRLNAIIERRRTTIPPKIKT